MKLTTNYSLKKPEGSDVVNIDDFNYNVDTIDTKLKSVENQSNTNKTNISTLQNEVSVNKSSIAYISDNIIPYEDTQCKSINDIPLKPGRYAVNCDDNSFPSTWGNVTVDYGSYNGEYIATFRSIGIDGNHSNTWVSQNRYGDLNDRGWKPWKKLVLDGQELKLTESNGSYIIIRDTGNVDNLVLGWFNYFNAKGTLPPGYNPNDNDFLVENKGVGENWFRQILYDVRSFNKFERMRIDGNWSEWRSL